MVISEYEEGESKFRHKVGGVALGLAGLGTAALVGHAAAKGQSPIQSLHDFGQHLTRMASKIPSNNDHHNHHSSLITRERFRTTLRGPAADMLHNYTGRKV